MPVVIRNLLDFYGLTGALLIVSGLMFNNVAVGAVMSQFPPFSLKIQQETDIVIVKENDSIYNSAESQELLDNRLYASLDKDFCSRGDTDSYNKGQKLSLIKTITRNLDRKKSFSDGATVGYNEKKYNANCLVQIPTKDLYKASRLDIYGSMQIPEAFSSVHSMTRKTLEMADIDSEMDDMAKERGILEEITTMMNLQVLRNYKLQLYLFVAFCSFCGSILIVTYIPPFARDQNISNSKVTTLITIVGGCDLFARVTLTFISDSKKLKRHHIMGFCTGMTGIAAILNPLYTSFETFVFYAVIHGLFGSVYFSMSVLVLRECVGLENMSIGMSLMISVHGLSSAIIAPLIGMFVIYRSQIGMYNK